MQNFRNLDYAIYQCADELLMCYNIRNRSIEYNHKNTIRTLKAESIDQNFYYRVLLAENSEKVQEAAMRRLVDLNIRPVQKTTNAADIAGKVTAWTAFTERLFRETAKQPQVMLKVFRHFLEAIEGRMKSQNILSVAPVTLYIKLQEPEQIRPITLPYCSSIYKLRLKIDEDFDLKHTDFEMYLSYTKLTTTFQQE